MDVNQETVPTNEDGVDSNHEIDDMLNDEIDLSDSPEEPSEDTTEVEEAPEDSAEETPDVVEEMAPAAETPEPAEKSEADSLREQLTHLSAILMQHGINPASLGQPLTESVQTTAPVTAPKPEETKLPTRTEVELKPLELSKEEFDAIFEAPEHLVGLLNKVRESAVEQVLRTIPTVTAQIVNQQTVLNRMVQDFYTANNDLAGVKPFVAVVANEIAARNPGWTVEQVFAEAAVESRNRLNLKKTVSKPSQPERKPGLPANTQSRRVPTTPRLSQLEQELQDLM